MTTRRGVKAEVPEAPAKVRVIATEDVRFAGVHYLPEDQVSVDAAVARQMIATGGFKRA